MTILENYSLKSQNTFGIDARARYYVEASSVDDFKALLDDATFKEMHQFILGGGSNILFTKDVEGIVIKNTIKGIELIHEDADFYYVKAGAGEIWHDLVLYCVANNYGGLENLSLIPGSVGAGPIQNIGAYGVEIKDTMLSLEALHIKDKTVRTFTNEACKFGYRESVFKNELKGQYIIVSVTYKLAKKPQLKTGYGAIEKELKSQGIEHPTIKDVSNAVIAIRSSKLPDPAVIGNAGSFFKNPEVAVAIYEGIKEKFPTLVAYDTPKGMKKLAAGWLIEQAGWKGKRLGDAGVHKLQALVLVNYGDASGAEIVDLSTKVIASVKEKFGVELEREVNRY